MCCECGTIHSISAGVAISVWCPDESKDFGHDLFTVYGGTSFGDRWGRGGKLLANILNIDFSVIFRHFLLTDFCSEPWLTITLACRVGTSVPLEAWGGRGTTENIQGAYDDCDRRRKEIPQKVFCDFCGTFRKHHGRMLTAFNQGMREAPCFASYAANAGSPFP